MSRARSVHRCGACGALSARWAGRCPSCGAWNSLAEQAVAAPAGPASSPSGESGWRGGVGAVSLGDVDLAEAQPRSTGLPELDRVLGGGLVPGSVTLLGGEPGVGKSTLLLQVLGALAERGEGALLVSAEESAQQVRIRAERLGLAARRVRLLATTDVTALVDALHDERPALVVLDSVQAVRDGAVGGLPGSLPQVRACADLLVGLAKTHRIPFVLVGHVTKDGTLAGPRALEHLVDTVVTVEGDRHHALRLVRAVKHRFGPTGELGLFDMGEGGLRAVTDPYRLLLGDRRAGAPGSAILPAMEGQRALLVEVQALASMSAGGSPPRRSAQGVDGGRLSLLLAVLENRAGVPVRATDVFCSAVGGIRVGEPAADLAVALAIASAVQSVPLPPNLVAFGEVGLTGEIRQVPHAPRRLAEAARVGFRHAVVPESCPPGPPGMELVQVRTLAHAIELASGVGPPSR
ncbi:MAG TPA: DNA repair protein RadA [Acidimicrobiales bacterium]|nr:DNA repair protein RadA [Acidimicrobiales bacterium]